MRRGGVRGAPLIAVFAALCALACKVDIQHGLDESEANQLLVTLEGSGIPSQKEREEGRPPTWKIRVPSSEASRSWQVLRQHELPRSRAKGFEVFGKGALIPSQTEERALYQQALSGEVTRLLQAYPGVIDARVLISLPRERALGTAAAAAKPSASVLVKHHDGEPRIKTPELAQLVAGAVPGLEVKDVVVVVTAVPAMPSASTDAESIGPFVVSSGSRAGLQVALGVGLLVIVLLGGAVVLGALMLRRLRTRLRELEAAQPGSR